MRPLNILKISASNICIWCILGQCPQPLLESFKVNLHRSLFSNSSYFPPAVLQGKGEITRQVHDN